MSKEAQRRAAARKQQRRVRVAKGLITVLMVVVIPVLAFIAVRG